MAENNEVVELQTKLGEEGIIFCFSYIEDETSTIEASITDNFVETNHSMQDHIAIKPRIYRLRGCVGEVVYKGSHKFLDAIKSKINNHPVLKNTLNKMKPITAVSPIISGFTQSAMNIVDQIESSYNRYRQILENNFQNKAQPLNDDHQKKAVAYLQRILESRIEVNLKGLMFNEILSADDPKKVFKRKYYLQSVSAHQGNNNFISDIEVTIKEFRIASTQVTTPDPKKYGSLNPDAVNKAPEQTVKPATGEKVMSTWENKHKNMSMWSDKNKYTISSQKVGGKTVQVEANYIKQMRVIKK